MVGVCAFPQFGNEGRAFVLLDRLKYIVVGARHALRIPCVASVQGRAPTAMKQSKIEALLRQIEELRPRKDCPQDERLRLLLGRQKLRRNIYSGRVRGPVDKLLEEVNEIYKSEVVEDRVRERAKAIRLQLLWDAIERRRRCRA